MIRTGTLVLTFMLAVVISAAYAVTYTWTDQQGTVHFSEDRGSVPAKLRSKVRTVEESEPSSSTAVLPVRAVNDEQQLVPREAAGRAETTADEVYGDKSYAQWQKELTDREAAMAAVRKRIDELAAELKSYGPQMNRQEKLLTEYNTLWVRFKEMKTEYYQQVEIARKAGLEINIQQ